MALLPNHELTVNHLLLAYKIRQSLLYLVRNYSVVPRNYIQHVMIIKQQQHNERHTNVSTMHSNMYHDHRGEFKSRIEYGMSIHIVW